MEKQLAQGIAFISALPVLVAGSALALTSGAHFAGAGIAAAYAVSTLCYGAMLCITLWGRKQTVVDLISRRLVLQDDSARKPAIIGSLLLGVCYFLALRFAEEQSILQSYWYSLTTLGNVNHHKFIDVTPYGCKKQYGFIDHSGKFKIKPIYDAAGDFHEGLAAVLIGGHWGYIDTNGDTKIALNFREAGGFSEGLAPVRETVFWNFIDRKGHALLAEPKFIYVTPFMNGVSRCVRLEHGQPKSVILSVSGKELTPRLKRSGEKITERATLIDAGGGQNSDLIFITKSGIKIFNQKLEDAAVFSEGKAAVKVDGKWGFIDQQGEYIIKPQFTQVGSFKNGVASVEVKGKFGLINGSGKFVLSPQYAALIAFERPESAETPEDVLYSEGMIPIFANHRWTFADMKTGKIIMKHKFPVVECFRDGLARVPEVK